MAPHFFPPMWEQRRICIARVLYDYGAQSVLEVGCGEGNVLTFLVPPAPDNRQPIIHLYGVDIRKDSLVAARGRLVPEAHDYRSMRKDELRIELYHGDATVRIASVNADAVVCTEVIEHVDECTGVPALTSVVLGAYRPRLAIFTTPNAEFNVNFAPLNYGKPDAKFRDEDHKFEWTRAQFAAWAEDAAARFGYSVELLPIGVKMRNAGADFVECGGCTQMAVFERKEVAASAEQTEAGCREPVLLDAIEYPTHGRMQELVFDTVRSMGDAQASFQSNDLWAVLGIRQQFRHRSALETWLQANSGYASSMLTKTRAKNGTACYSIPQEYRAKMLQ
ncbi:hypothetical protein IW140_004615 [Coemansia sp. RSA 1813]|nr:hypothetical protein EV178_002149 [Coemansia sp. RSA 1646]KAJ1767453.1 hypothetical protein LPJ74_005367 [Coemansia sp. RSA 1843]KAJ2090351.1 hypothetical protein IW138_002777 [Coemansia sp. RSA 986]KAJ2215537.1 hypothetical protein EV179_002130 [Coemansia sp. RSA 487]KAJ2567190.1 hypothetical protein IW140_004615 [Coemansia sp. RSA 1813]